jgi:4-hydroxy-tetrahydrodipicolinate synthase
MVPDTVARLAGHGNIFGIKEATGDVSRVASLREQCGVEFGLYSGDDATGREFMLAGGQGVVSVTSNVAPRAMAEMCRAALSGDADQAAALDAPLQGLHSDLFVEANPIPVKWVLHRMGLMGPGIRLPLLPLSDAQQPAVEAAMERAGLL